MATDMGSRVVDVARTWIKTPYVPQAGLKGVGCDCIGMVSQVFAEVTGRSVPKFPPYTEDFAEFTKDETMLKMFRSMLPESNEQDIEPGDILVFRWENHMGAKHCGIASKLYGEPSLIHSRQNKVVSEELFGSFWRRRLAGVFKVV